MKGSAPTITIRYNDKEKEQRNENKIPNFDSKQKNNNTNE